MKRMFVLAVSLWLGLSATAHAQVSLLVGTLPAPQVSAQTGAQVNSPTNAASTVTGAIMPSGQGVTFATGGEYSPFAPALVLCPFGVSLSASPTAFGRASDPLGAPTYQISAGAGVVATGPVGSISANAQAVTPNAASGAAGAGVGSSSSPRCLGAIPSMAGNAGGRRSLLTVPDIIFDRRRATGSGTRGRPTITAGAGGRTARFGLRSVHLPAL